MLTVQSLVFLLLLLLKQERNFLPPDNSPPPSFFSLCNSEYSPHAFYLKIAVAHFFVHTPMKYNYVIFNKQKTMGTQHTVGFVVHHIIYSSVWVLPDGQIQCTQIWVLCGKTRPMGYPYRTLLDTNRVLQSSPTNLNSGLNLKLNSEFESTWGVCVFNVSTRLIAKTEILLWSALELLNCGSLARVGL